MTVDFGHIPNFPKNMSLTFTVTEGNLKDDYTSFANTRTTTPAHSEENYNCLVKWSAQYQKANEDVPDPTYFMKILEDFTKELDTNLLKEYLKRWIIYQDNLYIER
ncbi:hypothetical protein MKW98_029192 [Papaver atlanticum]|uniref:Bet v I/Major latex protein domain-containing protein n=1 Tax=Papaver atlanticum TaxID=357466 RepID=A0AAD4T3R0_9MAGN|nr:hypothetical protein MKW98_029192 [Papaver atlanticum]